MDGLCGSSSTDSATSRWSSSPAAPTTVDNGTAKIPSFLLDPIAVTADKIKDTIVKDGFYQVGEICTGEVAAACSKQGLS